MTVIEMRDALQALIDQGRGNEPVMTFEAQYMEGDCQWEEADVVVTDTRVEVTA